MKITDLDAPAAKEGDVVRRYGQMVQQTLQLVQMQLALSGT